MRRRARAEQQVVQALASLPEAPVQWSAIVDVSGTGRHVSAAFQEYQERVQAAMEANEQYEALNAINMLNAISNRAVALAQAACGASNA